MTVTFRGAAFSAASDGDLRHDLAARAAFSNRVSAPQAWATLNQVHGSTVVVARDEGRQGDGDALISERPDLTIAVFTADCVGAVIEADEAVAVVHAGWRGAVAGVVEATLEAMRERGHEPLRAQIGPAIGPCCYEVGAEVADHFPGHVSTTTWGTTSVDVPSAVADAMAGVAVVRADSCTRCDEDFYSYRRDRTTQRQATVAWMRSTG